MEWTLDKNKAICPQIVEKISVQIAGGEYKPGEKLPSVREIALAAGVNPNTVQKAFEILEAKNMITTSRGTGSFVSEDTEGAKKVAEDMTKAKIIAFLGEMKALGYSSENVIEMIRRWNND